MKIGRDNTISWLFEESEIETEREIDQVRNTK